jgi:hypothetical protein
VDNRSQASATRETHTPGSPKDVSGNRGSSRRSSSSESPPLSTTLQWSAIRTGTAPHEHTREQSSHTMAQDDQPNAAGTGTRMDHAVRLVSRSPEDVGFAVSALESLSDERYYQPRPIQTTTSPLVERREDLDTEMAAPFSPPQDQRDIATLPPPPQTGSRSGRLEVIHSMPTSSRNSEDGTAETRCHDASGLGDGSSDRVHIDRHTQDRLLAIYWTHIHVSSSPE